MARLLPPESAAPDIVSREVGVGVQMLELVFTLCRIASRNSVTGCLTENVTRDQT